MVCAVKASTDQARFAWASVMLVCRLKIVLKRLVVRDVVPAGRDRIVSGQTRVMRSTNCPALRVSPSGSKSSLEPTPSNVLLLEQISDIGSHHGNADFREELAGRRIRGHAVVIERSGIVDVGTGELISADGSRS